MNTEQLEASLRSEIDGYVQTMREQMNQEISQLQSAIAEISRHNNVLTEKVKQLKEQAAPEQAAMSPEFSDVLTEHLRLAREEGAKIVTDAMSGAQEEPSQDLVRMRDAVSEISTQTSQAEILKSLLNHVSHFAPRGTLFIVKSENLVGWRSFGENQVEDTAREVQMPVLSDSILSSSIKNSRMETGTYGSYSGDRQFLTSLNYGQPQQMTALPLVVRGRGVAVLYVDGGSEEAAVKREALEILMRIAGLTVELLASARSAARQTSADSAAVETPVYQSQTTSSYVEENKPAKTEDTLQYEMTEGSFAEQIMPSFESTAPRVSDNYPPPLAFDQTASNSVDDAPAKTSSNAYAEIDSTSFSFEKPVESFENVQIGSFDQYAPQTNFSDYRYNSAAEEPKIEQSYDTFSFANTETTAVQEPSANYSVQSFDSTFAQPVETVVQTESVRTESAAAKPSVELKATPRRFGERNIELPIEVPEDEKRSHNDARRFARLLVSEIKLYNEQRVKEGRQASDIYERLSEAIDRSREMYDKRVNPAVSTKFDYFHYELVNTLAEGDDAKMGAAYPGATV